jgi:hypothetical protein
MHKNLYSLKRKTLIGLASQPCAVSDLFYCRIDHEYRKNLAKNPGFPDLVILSQSFSHSENYNPTTI